MPCNFGRRKFGPIYKQNKEILNTFFLKHITVTNLISKFQVTYHSYQGFPVQSD